MCGSNCPAATTGVTDSEKSCHEGGGTAAPQPPRARGSFPTQAEAVTRLARHLRRAGTRGLFVSATGTGKTLVAIRTADGLGARLVLFVVPTLDLAAQTALAWRRNGHLEHMVIGYAVPPFLGIHADARLALSALLETVPARQDPTAADRVRTVLDLVRERIDSQVLALEQRVLVAVRQALPSRSPSFWDMTILAYGAWSAFDARRPNTVHSAQGAGGLGYAFPEAKGGDGRRGRRPHPARSSRSPATVARCTP